MDVTTPASSSPAARSTKALPQRPTGSTSPMTLHRTSPSTMTFSIAPAAARMPQEIRAPSNAGPAAVDAAQILPSRASTISPFVPMSTIMTGPSRSARSVASSPATVSPPTNPPMTGKTYALPRGWIATPTSSAGSISPRPWAATKGTRPSCVGSMPLSRCCIVVLPANDAS